MPPNISIAPTPMRANPEKSPCALWPTDIEKQHSAGKIQIPTPSRVEEDSMNTTTQQRPIHPIVAVVLPGPDRKRLPAPYMFDVTYRNPNPYEPGCLMTWNVRGGREAYQVAAERTHD